MINLRKIMLETINKFEDWKKPRTLEFFSSYINMSIVSLKSAKKCPPPLQGMVIILVKILFSYFYCLRYFSNVFLMINQKLSVSRKVISKIQNYNSLLCKQGSCYVFGYIGGNNVPVNSLLQADLFHLLVCLEHRSLRLSHSF